MVVTPMTVKSAVLGGKVRDQRYIFGHAKCLIYPEVYRDQKKYCTTILS